MLRISGTRLAGMLVGLDLVLTVLVPALVAAGLVLIGGMDAADDLVVFLWSVGVSFLGLCLMTIVVLSLGLAARVWAEPTTRLPVLVVGARGLWARPRFRQSTTFWFPWTAIRSVRASRQWGVRPRLEIRTDDDVLAVPLGLIAAPTRRILAELVVRAAGRCPIGDLAQEHGAR